MDAKKNPYLPGAGNVPPFLAGRDHIREKVGIALARIQAGKPEQSALLVGLRGVGKTVLLRTIHNEALAEGLTTIWIEAPENRSLPAVLAPSLRTALIQLSKNERARALAEKALRGLAGFVNALRVKYDDIEFGFDIAPEFGLADNGDLEHDLQALLTTVGEAAHEGETALAIFIDELQYVEEEQLGAIITALHSCAQQQLPVVVVGAGLPQLPGKLGKAKSYAERLFEFTEIGPLSPDEGKLALLRPAEAEGSSFTDDAIRHILDETKGYPYFIQAWGKHTWQTAESSLMTGSDAIDASEMAIAELDQSFFRVRFDRLTPAEKKYLRGMAELGPGPHRSGDIATELGKQVTSLGPVRATLINKGMIWSPSHGDTAFTVPLFDQFMCRIMPGDVWRTE